MDLNIGEIERDRDLERERERDLERDRDFERDLLRLGEVDLLRECRLLGDLERERDRR